MRKPSKPGPGEESSWQTPDPIIENGMEGRTRRETSPLPGRENL
jgi:hypothetical protein